MLIRFLILATLLLAGCGASSDNVTTTATANPTSTGLLIDQARAVPLAHVVPGVVIPTGAIKSAEATAANVLQNLDGVRPATLAIGIMVQQPVLAQGGSRVINGALGGNVTVLVDPAGVNLAFSSFVSAANTTLNGNANLLGRGNQVNAVFTQLRVASATGKPFQLDGPAELVRAGDDLTFTTTAAVSDENGGTARFANYLKVIDFSESGTRVAGTFTTTGLVELANYRGLTGSLRIENLQPFAFTADLAGNGRTVTAGQAVYTGNGALRLTVVGPNLVEIALRPAGASGFTPLETVPYEQLVR